MPAWLAFEPVVLISRPISWMMNPSFLPGDRVHEILAVLAETDLLLVDVVFLEIEDEFLFEAGGIRLGLQLVEGFHQFGLDGFNPFSFKRFHLVIQGADRRYARGDVAIERGAFPDAVIARGRNGRVDRVLHRRPVLFRDGIGLFRIDDVREAEDGREQFGPGNGIDGNFRRNRFGLTQIGLGQGRIDGLGRRRGIRFEGQEEVDGPALQPCSEFLPHEDVLVFRKEGGLDVDVGALAVQGPDLHREFAGGDAGFGLPVAGHGLDHRPIPVCRNP